MIRAAVKCDSCTRCLVQKVGLELANQTTHRFCTVTGLNRITEDIVECSAYDMKKNETPSEYLEKATLIIPRGKQLAYFVPSHLAPNPPPPEEDDAPSSHPQRNLWVGPVHFVQVNREDL